jgi:hypothetical protein
VNPAIKASPEELARWLAGFATSHAKRDGLRIEARVEASDVKRDTLGLRLALGAAQRPAPPLPPIELATADVAAGRTRFDWCQALAERIRGEARALLTSSDHARPA